MKIESRTGATNTWARLDGPLEVLHPLTPVRANAAPRQTTMRFKRLEHRHGEERPEIVVRDTEPSREQPHDRPQHFVRDVAVEIEQQLEVGARFQDRERFFARAGDGAGDAHLALGDNEEPVAGLAFLEDVLADGELL